MPNGDIAARKCPIRAIAVADAHSLRLFVRNREGINEEHGVRLEESQSLCAVIDQLNGEAKA
jgi:hypothetical protein